MRIVEVKLMDQFSPSFKEVERRWGIRLVCGYISLALCHHLGRFRSNVTRETIMEFVSEFLLGTNGECECIHCLTKRNKLRASKHGKKKTQQQQQQHGRQTNLSPTPKNNILSHVERFVKEDSVFHGLVMFLQAWRNDYVESHLGEFENLGERETFLAVGMGEFEVSHIIRTHFNKVPMAFLRAVWSRPSFKATLEASQHVFVERLFLEEETHFAQGARELVLEVSKELMDKNAAWYKSMMKRHAHTTNSEDGDGDSQDLFKVSTNVFPNSAVNVIQPQLIPEVTEPVSSPKDPEPQPHQQIQKQRTIRPAGLLFDVPFLLHGEREVTHLSQNEIDLNIKNATNDAIIPNVHGLPVVVDGLGHFNVAVPLKPSKSSSPTSLKDISIRCEGMQLLWDTLSYGDNDDEEVVVVFDWLAGPRTCDDRVLVGQGGVSLMDHRGRYSMLGALSGMQTRDCGNIGIVNLAFK
eukprot:m.241752 g.241752  ORF g.241752 m.241752 type:complete len:466 (-) comp26464_c0_seq1:184-1581(-)